MKYGILVTAIAGGLVSACASSSDKVASTYVSLIQYTSYSCGQIREESARVSSRAATAAGVQDQKRKDDQVATAAAVVLFWPSAFLIDGDNAKTAELARLKGEMEALEQAWIRKNCGVRFQRSCSSASCWVSFSVPSKPPASNSSPRTAAGSGSGFGSGRGRQWVRQPVPPAPGGEGLLQ